MEQIILIVHMLAALAIIGLIMIQQGKGADMGASFGAGSSQTLFGSGGGGNVLTTSTSWLVTLFFATSFGLAVIAKNQSVAVNAVDLPVPAVVESQFAPVAEGDIPAIDEAAIGQGLSDDIPVLDAPAAPSELDIPEI
ncbi:MAG: preprotein translocase subunit SecG [Oceanicoccus sp.]|uniref:preprotein translocase subunit SecG n=1 Tax=Oceanicoccus sp. TaxID=2691044 RepID=UPI00260E9099|nr:preprotein translocase subunit SecG [Oceanicoccus sp.]MCP3908603.1 preprotein translocase subunit SecG [Oceanicoccus sp.]MDG1772542.1 preprotein translocase subunit SecG [Oceanicoccus sp.]